MFQYKAQFVWPTLSALFNNVRANNTKRKKNRTKTFVIEYGTIIRKQTVFF